MPDLFDIRFGPEAVIRGRARGVVRRIRHGDTTVRVDEADQVGLVLNLTETHRVKGYMGGTLRSDVPQVGSITVMPPGCLFEFTISGECSVLHLQLPWEKFASAAEAADLDAARIDLHPRLNADDPQLALAIYQATISDVSEQGDWVDRIVASLILADSSAAGATSTSQRGGISPVKLRRVFEKIDADLGAALQLADLAAVAGLSLFHFSRVFAGATGVTPHQYVLRRRVDRAVQLLDRREHSVDDVARAVGFQHSSHLARTMRRLTGTTPDVFRRQILP